MQMRPAVRFLAALALAVPAVAALARAPSVETKAEPPMSTLLDAGKEAHATELMPGLDYRLIEVNEAFSPVVLAWQRETGADLARVNVRGGAIAIGHPLGASGARIMTTLLHALEDRGGRYGLQTMCEAGGLANATIVERL